MNNLTSKTKPLLQLVLGAILSSSLFMGCDNNSKTSNNNFSVKQKVQSYSKDTVIKGKVSNKKGTILSGKIKVTDTKGKLIVSTSLHNNYHYSVTIPAGTVLPIELHFYPSTKNNDAKKMTSVIIYPNIKTYDINDLTTAIAKQAKALGGYTHAHMVSAAESSVSVPDSNKTTAGFRGDPTKQYGGWH